MKNTKSKISIEPLNGGITKQFKAGQYIVIDLCYIYPDDEWSEYCDNDFSGEEYKHKGKSWAGAILNYDGFDIFTCSTKWGDGGYPLYKNNELLTDDLCVDAGMLALIPVKLAKTWPQWEENKHLGYIVDCDKDFVIHVFGDKNYSKGKERPGNWEFLDFRVITDGDNEEENEGY